MFFNVEKEFLKFQPKGENIDGDVSLTSTDTTRLTTGPSFLWLRRATHRSGTSEEIETFFNIQMCAKYFCWNRDHCEWWNQSADEHILTEMKIFEQAGLMMVVEMT